ncbi:PREDICTED: yrdC domain-containing protein, mitochondrial isoform X2 [Gekko japonicus]|uniref:Threonylcarbamoyl-AMP synthase n=1 Tax=Gekko japonicus TaxID=146911 RepID=A0ABM1JY36_GEKJA|nr:PREDICTED: yrdC domain-containing protein, mitochondrial isoform X2 [Gekko japonicus]
MLGSVRRRGLRAVAGALSGAGAARGGSAAAVIPLLPLAGPSAEGRERALSSAVVALREGGLVAVPTDTVYGVACLAQDSRALRAVYRLKGRDGAKPLAICLADVGQVHRYCKVAVPDQLLHDLLPGPVTLVLERSQTLNPDLNPFTPEFQELWPHLALVVDGGPIGDLQRPECRLGSTVVDISVPGKFKVIRPGCALTQTVEILVKKHGLTAIS